MRRLIMAMAGVVAVAVVAGVVGRVALDRSNAAHLARLGPNERALTALVGALEQRSGCWVWITSGYRTAEEQARLARADARNAAPGRSRHEHARAIDLNLVCPQWVGMVRKSSTRASWVATGAPAVARAQGFAWGGDIPGYYDPVHFQR